MAVQLHGAEVDSSVETFRSEIQPIIQKHCVQCHGPEKQKGKFRIDELDARLHEGQSAGYWHEVLDQLNEGEMPPEDESQLTDQELAKFTTWLETGLKQAAAKRVSTGGRQMMRRMSRYEYQYTLQDLLGVALDYTPHIPGDFSGEDGLMTNARHLGMSPVLMQGYMEVSLMAMDEALPDPPEKIYKETVSNFQPAKIRGQRELGAPKKQKKGEKPSPKPQLPKTDPRILAPTPGFQLSHFKPDLPRKTTFNERPFSGRFAIRVKAKGTASSDGRIPELTIHVGHRASGDYDPKKIMGSQMVDPAKGEHIIEFTGNIEDFPLGKKDGYYNGSGSHDVTHLSTYLWNTAEPREQYTQLTPLTDVDEPLIHLTSIEFEGPLHDGYPSELAKQLLPVKPEAMSEEAHVRVVLSSFLRKAFRRDIQQQEIDGFLKTFQQFKELTGDFRAAMRKTFASVLVSPKFLYLVEPANDSGEARPLNEFELATRLSYFLWASMPDDELLNVASSGKLSQTEVLRQQVQRMLNDTRFSRFARHFSNQWLGLSSLENVAINPKVYPNFSDLIREALKEETLSFSEYIFTQDLSSLNFVHSDFAMLNNTLASHYGINGVHGSHMRPVKFEKAGARGGVLTQGSILLMGSDGTESNPIYRGVWLRKRLFADPPPPPPPGAPPLEKKDDSKLSLKEQIALHRETPACARCHNKIDPWGIAFEAYDATGQIKNSHYDASTLLPGGTEVEGMKGLQAHIIANKSRDFANGFARRIVGYALGRQLEYSDDALIEDLTQQLVANNFRPSSLIEGIVTSPAFLTK
jgi:cytochrome c553